MKAKRRILIVALCVLMMTTAAMTLALMNDRDAMVNTFVAGSIQIDLDESAGILDDDSTTDEIIREFEMLEPGESITKDPVITVLAGSEDCWVFAKVTASDNFDDYLTYEMDKDDEGNSMWIPLGDEYPGVYYYYVPIVDVTEDRTIEVLEGNAVQIRSDITKSDIRSITNANAPTLEITAYAIQHAGFETPQEAWQAFAGEENTP